VSTQLFLRAAKQADGHCLGLQLDPNFWDASTGRCYLSDDYSLATSRGAAADFGTYTAVTGPTVPKLAQPFQFGPIVSAFTMSGTITFNVWGRQSVDSNAGLIMRVMKYSAVTDAMSLVVESAKGTELATSATTSTVNNWTASGYSAVNFGVGDRVYVVLGFDDAGGNMIAGGTLRHDFDGATPGAVGDSYVTFTEDFTQDTSSPSGSQLFLRDTASDIVDQGGAINEKALSTSRGAGATSGVTNTVNGPSSGIQATVSGGGNVLEWYSGRLDPFSLVGKAYFRLTGLQSAVARNAAFRVEVHRVDNDGTNAVLWAAGLLSRSGNIANLATTSQIHEARLLGPSLGVAGGQRVRVRVFVDDSYAETFSTLTTGGTATMEFDGASGGAAGDTYLTLAETVAAYSGPPADPVGPYLIPIAEIF